MGASSPATRLSSVDLPQPEWPISVTNSPLATVREMSRSASKRWPRLCERHADVLDVQVLVPCAARQTVDAVVEALRDEDERLLEQEADDADHEDRDDDVVDLQVVPLVPHPEADAHAAGEHLGGDDHEPRDADREAHAGQHVRQHRGEEDLA